MTESDLALVRDQLKLFSGGTGGIDSLLTTDPSEAVCARLGRLHEQPLSCSQFNQLLALSHQPEMSDGFFRYYWLTSRNIPTT